LPRLAIGSILKGFPTILRPRCVMLGALLTRSHGGGEEYPREAKRVNRKSA
jgi:hypothetical protein